MKSKKDLGNLKTVQDVAIKVVVSMKVFLQHKILKWSLMAYSPRNEQFPVSTFIISDWKLYRSMNMCDRWDSYRPVHPYFTPTLTKPRFIADFPESLRKSEVPSTYTLETLTTCGFDWKNDQRSLHPGLILTRTCQKTRVQRAHFWWTFANVKPSHTDRTLIGWAYEKVISDVSLKLSPRHVIDNS